MTIRHSRHRDILQGGATLKAKAKFLEHIVIEPYCSQRHFRIRGGTYVFAVSLCAAVAVTHQSKVVSRIRAHSLMASSVHASFACLIYETVRTSFV